MRVPRKKESIERILAVIGDLEPRVREHVHRAKDSARWFEAFPTRCYGNH